MRLLTIASAWPVVAASRRLRAAHREKHWRYKAYSEAKSELILRLEIPSHTLWSFLDGYRTRRPEGFKRADHPRGPSGSWWYNFKENKREGALVRFFGVTSNVFSMIVEQAAALRHVEGVLHD